jgi:cullin-associated NEDD8-dissociated protein 1
MNEQSAYETLYALMDTAFTLLAPLPFFDRVIAGLSDEHDIRILCKLMLTKLIVLAPEETERRLDAIADQFRTILSFKPKETAVKQELEKAEEASKAVLTVSVQLHRRFPAGGAAAVQGGETWRAYWDWLRRDMGAGLRAVEEETTNNNNELGKRGGL